MKSRLLFFGVLVLATCLTQLATDIYSPSLPAIAEDLNTSINYVQGSMSIYMLSVSLSLLIYGPLSEGIGRKIPLIIGLVFMVIGSIMCSISADIDLLIIGRFIQGFGAGACSGLWRTIFRDAFSGDDLAKYTSYLVIFIMFIVAAGPIAGGYLQEFFGWQASFIFMTIYSLVALIGIILWLEETNKDYHISKLKLGYIIKHYLVLLRSPIFMGVTCSTFLSYGAFFHGLL